MHRFFVEPSACGGDAIRIGGADRNHMKNVLRLKPGEQVRISDGTDREYICAVARYTEEAAELRILDIVGSCAELPVQITLYQGYPKGDKLELIVQKAVELGAARIVPVLTKRSVVRLDEGKAKRKVERYNAIARSAAEQSGRAVIPVVERVMSWREALEDAARLEMNLIPYENAEGIRAAGKLLRQAVQRKSLGIFIGPEGGFETEEVTAAQAIGAASITLGQRILRTETAGMAVLSILMFAAEETAGRREEQGGKQACTDGRSEE